MKKIYHLAVVLLTLSTSPSWAQVTADSSQLVREGAPQIPYPPLEQTPNYTKDLVRIKAADMPRPVQQALQSTEYKGWENAALYRSKSSDMYVVEMKDGDKTKTYRFDANGKPIKE